MKDNNFESKEKKVKIEQDIIFAKENVNTGRQPEVDYLKTLGVFTIVVYHVYLGFSQGYLMMPLKNLCVILTAGCLMFLMGIGMKYSRHHEIKDYICRGFLLLTLGQYLYLIRDTIPNLIGWWITGDKRFIARALLVFQSDILTFAGFTYFFLVILKKMKLSDFSILIIGMIMNLISYPLFRIMKSPSNYLLSQFLGYFVLTDAESYFPLIGYFVYVAFGYWIGGFYQRLSNKDKFYNRILIFLLPIVAIYHYIRSYYNIPFHPELYSVEHYCLSPGLDSIVRCMASLVFLAGFYKIEKILGKTPYFVSHCGKNLNQYYIISFVLTTHIYTVLNITRGEKFIEDFKYSDLLAFMILFSCRIIIDMNDKYIHFGIITLKNKKRNIVFALIWIISIISLIYIYPKVEIYANIWNGYLY